MMVRFFRSGKALTFVWVTVLSLSFSQICLAVASDPVQQEIALKKRQPLVGRIHANAVRSALFLCQESPETILSQGRKISLECPLLQLISAETGDTASHQESVGFQLQLCVPPQVSEIKEKKKVSVKYVSRNCENLADDVLSAEKLDQLKTKIEQCAENSNTPKENAPNSNQSTCQNIRPLFQRVKKQMQIATTVQPMGTAESFLRNALNLIKNEIPSVKASSSELPRIERKPTNQE